MTVIVECQEAITVCLEFHLLSCRPVPLDAPVSNEIQSFICRACSRRGDSAKFGDDKKRILKCTAVGDSEQGTRIGTQKTTR